MQAVDLGPVASDFQASVESLGNGGVEQDPGPFRPARPSTALPRSWLFPGPPASRLLQLLPAVWVEEPGPVSGALFPSLLPAPAPSPSPPPSTPVLANNGPAQGAPGPERRGARWRRGVRCGRGRTPSKRALTSLSIRRPKPRGSSTQGLVLQSRSMRGRVLVKPTIYQRLQRSQGKGSY